jgi:hypothetical protein
MVCTPSAPWRSWLEPRKPIVSSDPQIIGLGLRACACSADPERVPCGSLCLSRAALIKQSIVSDCAD